jgi:SAM-dependent methyltransferase
MGARYKSLVFDAIPAGCERAFDVGCGNGELTRGLRDRGIPQVIGLDRDEPCIQRCSRPGPVAASPAVALFAGVDQRGRVTGNAYRVLPTGQAVTVTCTVHGTRGDGHGVG